MCFSASASFTTGAALAIIGAMTLRRASVPKEWPLAAVPLLFAAQQLAEGFLWLILRGQLHLSPYWPIQVYAAFVGIVWPALIPLSLLLVEPHRARRVHFTVPLLLGAGVALYALRALIRDGVTAQINHQCILYETPAYSGIVLIVAYVIATCGGFLCSSRPSLRIVGWMQLGAFLAAFYFYRAYLTSTWCFFAAMISGFLYLHFSGLLERRPARETA